MDHREQAEMTTRAALLLFAAVRLSGQMPAEPDGTLARARVRIVATLRQLPKYTCVQTIDRSYYVRAVTTSIPSCDDTRKSRDAVHLNYTDRVRLDVAQSEGREIHSWPGATRFETGNLEDLVEHGPVGTGSFGGYLLDIFDNPGTQFTFSHESADRGRRVFTFSYGVARDASHYRIRTNDGWFVTPYEGTFDLDAASLELLRITVATPDLPPETSLCRAQSSLEYAPVHIGDSDFLLPSQSQLRLINRGTVETNSATVFTGCKEYLAESSVHFGEADLPGDHVAAGRKLLGRLPEGIRLVMRLNAPIDSDTAAAGDAVTATLTSAVRDQKSREILFPAGAVALGRISLMQHSVLPTPRFMVGIHWDVLTNGADSAPFTAILDRTGEMLQSSTQMQSLRRRPVPIGPPDALTSQAGGKRYVIPARYEMRWVTVTPPPLKSQSRKND